MVFDTNYRVRDGESWRFLDHVGISTLACYRIPWWIKLSILGLAQARESFRWHEGISTPIYGKL